MNSDELIKSVDKKLELLLLDKEDLKRIILGRGNQPGLADDVREIRKVLQGDPAMQIEGLIAKVNRMDELHKKFKYTGALFGTLIAIGGAVGGFITWLVHQGDKAKEVVKAIIN